MKTFLFTTLFWFIALTAGWIYLSSYKSDLLYSTLQTMNPATQAVDACTKQIDSLSGSLNAKLDEIASIVSSLSITGATSLPAESTTGIVKVVENLLPLSATTATTGVTSIQ